MTFIRIGFTASMVFCARLAAAAVAQKQDQKNDKTSPPVWTVPDINALPDDAAGRLVRHGRDLITMTDAYIGPHAADRDTRFAGNNLACGNCHLEAGTKKFGLPIFGLASDFPRYSARTGADISIEERMNGRPLPVQSPDMQALAAYVKFLSSGVVQGEQVSRSRRGHYARTRSRGGPQTWQARLYTRLSGLPQYERIGHCAKPAGNEPRLRRSFALGRRQFQRWRRDGEAHHAREFPSFQHAAWGRLSESNAVKRSGLGCGGLCRIASAAA